MSFSRALLLALVCASQIASAQSDRRILAVGDIHGAYDEFVSLLTRTGVIDANQRWTAGRATLVQTGDFTDRGAKVRSVLDLLMTLEERAKAGGGELVTLLGNHEVLNIIGDLRYVTPEIAAAFADAKSESRREQAWKDYEALAARRAKVRPSLPPALRQTRDAWMTAHPPGWLEYREALGPRGKYGRWLRSKNVATTIAGTVFMHAGINPDQPTTVDAVNARARQEMARYEAFLDRLTEKNLALPFFTLTEVLGVASAELEAIAKVMEEAKTRNEAPDLSAFDVPLMREAVEITKIGGWYLLAGEGPLWFRGYANWPEDPATTPKIHAFLDKLGVQRIAVGHTPTNDSRIAVRFGGRVFVIDTGMLAATYKGRPSMLEIKGTDVAALYEDGRVPLSLAPAF